MTDFTPPPELVQRWRDQAPVGRDIWAAKRRAEFIAMQAARWGSDQELEACCEHLQRIWSPSAIIDSLRIARRQKPPSLKEQALEEIQEIEGAMYSAGLGCDFTATRAALEALPND